MVRSPIATVGREVDELTFGVKVGRQHRRQSIADACSANHRDHIVFPGQTRHAGGEGRWVSVSARRDVSRPHWTMSGVHTMVQRDLTSTGDTQADRVSTTPGPATRRWSATLVACQAFQHAPLTRHAGYAREPLQVVDG